MKIKKILAAVAAAAVAVSAMAVNAFASEPVKASLAGYKPIPLLNEDVPDALYGAGVEVTFNISVNNINGGWANGSAGIIAGEEYLADVKYGGTACDAEGNRSWFPEGSVVIGDTQKTASITCKADLTGKSDFNIFIYSGEKDDTDFFILDSITIKNAAGFEATYADGKLTVTSGGNADADSAPEDDGGIDEAAPAPAAADDEDLAPADNDADEADSEEEDDADEADSTPADNGNVDADTDSTPAGDSTTTSNKTGNVPAAAMVSVMALAGVAAAASKKRK